MYAVVRIGGAQYRVAVGDTIKTQKIGGEIGGELKLDDVLLLSNDDLHIGKPTVPGAFVKAIVMKQAREKKILVVRFRKRGGFRRRHGHRQHFTQLRVTEIGKN